MDTQPKIYTKVGDHGMTELWGVGMVSKFNPSIILHGTIDGLQIKIGAIKLELTDNPELYEYLEDLQRDCITIPGYMQKPQECPMPTLPNKIAEMEAMIDMMTEHLPPLKNFLLAGINKAELASHEARNYTRSIEVMFWSVNNTKEMDINLGKYYNRLSDYFFTLARFLAQKDVKYIREK